MHTTPKKINAQAERLIRELGLEPLSAVWLKLRKVSDFTPETHNCLVNCMVQQKYHGGDIVFGWVIWQDTTIRFCEAEFHCVWRDLTGGLFDITPRVDGEKRVCFVPDPQRASRLDRSVHPPVTRTFGNVHMREDQLMNTVQREDIIFTKDSLLKHLTEELEPTPALYRR